MQERHGSGPLPKNVSTPLEAEGFFGNKVPLRYTEVVRIPGPDDNFEPGLYAGVEAWYPEGWHPSAKEGCDGSQVYRYVRWLGVRIGPVPEDPGGVVERSNT